MSRSIDIVMTKKVPNTTDEGQVTMLVPTVQLVPEEFDGAYDYGFAGLLKLRAAIVSNGEDDVDIGYAGTDALFCSSFENAVDGVWAHLDKNNIQFDLERTPFKFFVDGLAPGVHTGTITWVATGKNSGKSIPLNLHITSTIAGEPVPAGSVIVTASNWPGITVGTIFKKSVNTNIAFDPTVDCWYPGGGSINVAAVSPVIYGFEPLLVRDWASGVGDYGYRVPQDFTKPPVGTFNGIHSSAPGFNATFALYSA